MITDKILFDAAKFKKWVLEQPDSRGFNYFDTGGCLFASFFNEAFGELKERDISCGGNYLRFGDEIYSFSPDFQEFNLAVARLPNDFTIEEAKEALDF